MARSRVKGAASLRRLLRKLPDAMRDDLAWELGDIGRRLLGRARAETPEKFGGLRSALNISVAPKTLVLKLGLLTKRLQRRYFYGYVLDQGRRSRVVEAKRRTPSGGISTYAMRIRGISQERYNFVFGRRADFIRNELPKLRKSLHNVLSKVSKGVGND